MKKFVMGVIVGAVFAFGISAYADDIAKLVGKAVDNEYPVVLNGTPLSNKAPSIEGTSYAPVREISEKLGLNVKFENNTVVLSKQQEVEKVTEVVPSQVEKSTEEKLKELTISIEEMSRTISGLKHGIGITQSLIDTARPESNTENYKKSIIEDQAKIAELEKEKIGLESKRAELKKQTETP